MSYDAVLREEPMDKVEAEEEDGQIEKREIQEEGFILSF